MRISPRALACIAALAVWAMPDVAMADSCSITVVPVTFGTYQPLSATPRDSTGRITLDCNKSLTATVALNEGINSASFSTRQMSNGSSRLAYQLYTNASHSIVWGDGTGGSLPVLMLEGTSHTIYGRVPTQQMVGAGAYSDTILVTLSF